jgi:hypothetical protein
LIKIFIRTKNVKKLLLLIGELLIMTQITGCLNKPNKKEIVDKFNDFITMFPSKDLSSLYDKEGDRSNLEDGDLGIWVISSFLNTTTEKGDEMIGVVLGFNKNTRKAKGKLILNEGEIKNKYPIYYDKSGIHLVDEDIKESIKEELANFRMMYDFISLNREYLDSLESTRILYNGEVPLYKAIYKLNSKDKNINKIKQIYPELPIDISNSTLNLSGEGTPWNTTSSLSLEIFLDDNTNNYFSSSMRFSRSDEFNNLIEGE